MLVVLPVKPTGQLLFKQHAEAYRLVTDLLNGWWLQDPLRCASQVDAFSKCARKASAIIVK